MQSLPTDVVITTTPERIALARRTHLTQPLTLLVPFTAIVAFVGLLWRTGGDPQLMLILWIVVGFLGLLVYVSALAMQRPLRKAMRCIAADGQTQLVVSDSQLRIADVAIPLDRVTLVAALLPAEDIGPVFRGGFLSGTSNGLRLGRLITRNLRSQGADSEITLGVGIDLCSSIDDPRGFVHALDQTASHDPGWIEMPFGAFQGIAELGRVLDALRQHSQGRFPVIATTDGWEYPKLMEAAREPRHEIARRIATR
ncbi:MAG: hypothetical protein Q4D79_14980 [Propionibacteriaceae bacterium]|nr:hypothetical protein [Propionibacteriaceae bacterium]